jgi:RND family efflux transporter MFP subunit
MNKKRIITAGAGALVILIIVMLFVNKSEIEAKKNMKLGSGIITVEAAMAEEREGNSYLNLVGVTAADEEVQVLAQTTGQVTNVYVKPGDFVKKGKVMVQVDDKLPALEVESAKLNLEKMEDELNKTKKLYEGGAATETKYRDDKINLESAKIRLQQAEKQYGFTKITAPIEGNISQKNVERGSFVSTGTPIVYIVNTAQLKVVLNMSEKDIYKISAGQQVEIISNVHPGVKYQGKVSFISPKGDQYHNYPVEIAINNQGKAALKSGTFVTVKFQFEQRKSLQIPRTALVGSIKDAKVFKIENNRVKLVKIVIASDYGNYFEIASGLGAGDQVVTTGQINLSDNDPVKIINK